jgi:dihydroxyacetone kinase-like protein
MGDVDTITEAKRVLTAVATALEQHADELSALDAALGDGDHGVSMTVGFRGVLAALDAWDAPDLGALLDRVGRTLVSSVGAAMGPLYGTAFMRAGKVVNGRQEIDGPILAAMLEAARDGVIARGKASPGDKTMLDAIAPAAEAARQAADSGAGVVAVLRAASEAADKGAIATRDMLARKGRASRLGERTLGHQDPGATSAALTLRAALLALAPASADEPAVMPG